MSIKKCVAITIAASKGGVGKSMTTAALGYLLGKKHNTLLIDTDPQCNLGTKFNIAPNDNVGPLGEMIESILENPKADIDIRKYTITYPESGKHVIDILPCGKLLKAKIYDRMFYENPINAMKIFKKIISAAKSLNKYDYIMIDTSPSFGHEMDSILLASDYLLIPITESMDSIDGADSVIQLKELDVEDNPNLKLAGIFFNQVDPKGSKAFNAVYDYVKGLWGDDVLKTTIPFNRKAISESILLNEPVTKRYPAAAASIAFNKLLKEVVNRIG